MRRTRDIVIVMCTMVLAAGSVFAGINSKEVGALLIYPEYWATDDPRSTYITVTNDMTTDVTAHIEVIGGFYCGDCNFNLPLTGQQTKRLLFQAGAVAGTVDIFDSSDWEDFPFPGQLLRSCPEQSGFVVVSIEEANKPCALTLGENRLHGDLVVIDYPRSDSYQTGAIAVQAAGAGNNGDRHFDFNNMEYAAFPNILTANFWAEQPPRPPVPYPQTLTVDPTLVLFNVNRMTAAPVIANTHCAVTFVDAKETEFSTAFNFGCWLSRNLTNIDPGMTRTGLGTENGYFWLKCDPGTHGSLNTNHDDPGGIYAPATSLFGDTLFQSVTRGPDATLWITPRVSCP
jgi:hypothetical protein